MPAVVALLAASLAGCLAGGPDAALAGDGKAPRTHAALDALEPDDLVAPTFSLLGPIAAGGPAYGAGEPSVAAALDGRLFVAFPGCDQGFYLISLPMDEGTCEHGLVYESHDDGATWNRLNRDGDGRYTDDGPAANNDADVAVDSAGTVYMSNLGGGGIQIHRYDGEGNWTYVDNIVPPREGTEDPDDREGADRQWIAAAGPGHIINTWMRTNPNRDVAINTTFDGGKTWTGTSYFGDDIGWLGTVQFAPDGQHAYIPYTQPLQNDLMDLQSWPCAMHVLMTSDGGATWEDIDTGARWYVSSTGLHWSCVQMAPALDVTGDGTVVVAWAQDEFIPESTPPFTATSASTILYAMTSPDGRNWTEPQFITTDTGLPSAPLGNSIMPWVTGGAGDRFVITYLHNPVPTDGDYTAALWDVRAAAFDGFGTDSERRVDIIIEQAVHAGGICTRGGTCLITGSDRSFLDFFEADVTPDGRLIVAYPHDLNPTKMIEIRVAIQDGGSPLLIPAQAPV